MWHRRQSPERRWTRRISARGHSARFLVKWGILTPERVDKALLLQEEQKAKGLNVRIGDVMAEMGFITEEQRDRAGGTVGI